MGEKTTGVCKGDDGSVGVSLEDGEKLCLNANTNLSSLCRIVPTPCCHVLFFMFFFFFFFSLLYSLSIPDTCPHVASLFIFLFFFFRKKSILGFFFTPGRAVVFLKMLKKMSYLNPLKSVGVGF